MPTISYLIAHLYAERVKLTKTHLLTTPLLVSVEPNEENSMPTIKIIIKIIFQRCLNRYYLMILNRCYYKSLQNWLQFSDLYSLNMIVRQISCCVHCYAITYSDLNFWCTNNLSFGKRTIMFRIANKIG